MAPKTKHDGSDGDGNGRLVAFRLPERLAQAAQTAGREIGVGGPMPMSVVLRVALTEFLGRLTAGQAIQHGSQTIALAPDARERVARTLSGAVAA